MLFFIVTLLFLQEICAVTCEFEESGANALRELESLGYTATPLQLEFINSDRCTEEDLTAGLCESSIPGITYMNIGDTNDMTNPVYETDVPLEEYMCCQFNRDRTALRMAPGDAIVLFGCTPPKLRYFSFANWIQTRYYGSSWEKIVADLGDSLNMLRIKAGAEDDGTVFGGQRFTVVTGTDASISAQIEDVFDRNTPNQFGVNSYPIAGKMFEDDEIPDQYDSDYNSLKFGLGQYDDQFAFISRWAWPEDETAFEIWKESLPIRGYRISQPQPVVESDPFSVATHIEESHVPIERHLTAAQDFLCKTIEVSARKQYDILSKAEGKDSNPGLGEECALSGESCHGNSRDTFTSNLYDSLGRRAFSLPTSDSIILVAGINHDETGCSYFNEIDIINNESNIGILGWGIHEVDGSADPYLADSPYSNLAANFFVVSFAYDCTGLPWDCKEIDSEGLLRLDVGSEFRVLQHFWVNHQTEIRSTSEQILHARMWTLQPLTDKRVDETAANDKRADKTVSHSLVAIIFSISLLTLMGLLWYYQRHNIEQICFRRKRYEMEEQLEL